jgi:hypothetical protein
MFICACFRAERHMNRILTILVSFASAYFLRKLFAGGDAAPAGGAHADAPTTGARAVVVRVIAEQFAQAHIDEKTLGLLTAGAGLGAVALAYLCAAILRERGFGVGIGSLICFTGAAAALGALAFLAPRAATPSALTLAAAAGAAAAMVACTILKALALAKFDSFASGGAPAAKASRSAARIDAAIARRR